MNGWQKARIYWIPASAGGRKQPPPGPRYSTVARFNETKEWSVVVEFAQQPNARGYVEGQIRFLAPDAPFYLLQPGCHCHLIEGTRVVATVEIPLNDKGQRSVNGTYQQKRIVEGEGIAGDELQPISFGAE